MILNKKKAVHRRHSRQENHAWAIISNCRSGYCESTSTSALIFNMSIKSANMECLQARNIVEAIRSCPLFVLVIRTLTRIQKVSKPKVLGRPFKDICTIINTESSPTKNDFRPLGTIKTITSNRPLAIRTTEDERVKGWPEPISILDWFTQ